MFWSGFWVCRLSWVPTTFDDRTEHKIIHINYPAGSKATEWFFKRFVLTDWKTKISVNLPTKNRIGKIVSRYLHTRVLVNMLDLFFETCYYMYVSCYEVCPFQTCSPSADQISLFLELSGNTPARVAWKTFYVFFVVPMEKSVHFPWKWKQGRSFPQTSEEI
jgi:hypothetical protein